MRDSVSARRLSTVFFFNDTATTEIYTLSLHDALPISLTDARFAAYDRSWRSLASYTQARWRGTTSSDPSFCTQRDRKSTRLNSSHLVISYAVFCLKKKKTPNLLISPLFGCILPISRHY